MLPDDSSQTFYLHIFKHAIVIYLGQGSNDDLWRIAERYACQVAVIAFRDLQRNQGIAVLFLPFMEKSISEGRREVRADRLPYVCAYLADVLPEQA